MCDCGDSGKNINNHWPFLPPFPCLLHIRVNPQHKDLSGLLEKLERANMISYHLLLHIGYLQNPASLQNVHKNLLWQVPPAQILCTWQSSFCSMCQQQLCGANSMAEGSIPLIVLMADEEFKSPAMYGIR